MLVEKADRAHHVFRNVKSCFSVDDPHKLRQWLTLHLSLVVCIHVTKYCTMIG